jgi:hypothetical protein
MQNDYQLWVHRGSGSTYAVQLDQGRVTGVHGTLDPLSPGAPRREGGSAAALARYPYDGAPAAREVLSHREEFVVFVVSSP